MDYYGLFPKFKFNRKLNIDEKNNKLKNNQRIDASEQSLISDAKVISMNSHYL